MLVIALTASSKRELRIENHDKESSNGPILHSEKGGWVGYYCNHQKWIILILELSQR